MFGAQWRWKEQLVGAARAGAEAMAAVTGGCARLKIRFLARCLSRILSGESLTEVCSLSVAAFKSAAEKHSCLFVCVWFVRPAPVETAPQRCCCLLLSWAPWSLTLSTRSGSWLSAAGDVTTTNAYKHSWVKNLIVMMLWVARFQALDAQSMQQRAT